MAIRPTVDSILALSVYDPGDRVSLDSIGLEFAIGELYRGVDRTQVWYALSAFNNARKLTEWAIA
ncbi:MAG: hypothetical protein AAGD25_27270 [Cyanobacteria bacterium P01_F01_bin.150]